MHKHSDKVGIWIIGAYGEVATTLTVGTLALRHGLTSRTGLVSELAPMSSLDLVAFKDLVFGGHDIVEDSVLDAAHRICHTSRSFSYQILEKLKPDLEKIDRNMVTLPEMNWSIPCGSSDSPALSSLVFEFRKQLKHFINQHSLKHVVVVNIASAEAQVAFTENHSDLAAFERLIENDEKTLVSPSMLYAYAGFHQGCSFINFTPNTGASIPALQQLALKTGVPHYGNDGKTGETLVKTVLAPMFAYRNLRVMSWAGTNLLGNSDGQILESPECRQEKIKNKEAVLSNILNYPVHSNVDIHYVPSLGDWKTAWDLIHFQGFLDAPMTMQFTWQGCDSILAAPLVLDMVRFAELASRHGESGLMPHLSCFFKNPMDIQEHAFHKQFEMLLSYSQEHLQKHKLSAGTRNI